MNSLMLLCNAVTNTLRMTKKIIYHIIRKVMEFCILNINIRRQVRL